METGIAKTYEPSTVEDKLYKKWEQGGYFTARPDENKKPFTIVIPPPNVTGRLHMGHAIDETLQDILIRWRRMQGYSALWLPGVDHAGIATQIKVEEQLRTEEGLTRHDLGREAFLERVWEWKRLYGDGIINQLKRLGCSCDWTRERFTMDEGCSRAVREVFVNLYNEGLIYRGNRIINWCPSCSTALSDAEVQYEEQAGHFYNIKYPFEDGSGFLIIATTRPETLLGDTAVAVHPEDERYARLIGKTLILPLVNRRIPVIADEYVDREFGTGAVKITPAHDPNDFEVGQRHNLEIIKILNDDATISSHGGVYEGLDRYAAREKIVEDLKKEGLLENIRDHSHNVGRCYRCTTVVEPLVSEQWFVKMAPLAGPAVDVVKKGEIKFVPERFSKIYLNWMENVHDWCISRQLWWGHRIPAFYCTSCGEMTVSKEDLNICPKCGGKAEQDSDVLDTWFSSALWPFSTLGWPDDTEDLNYFYPTSVLVTSYDIIFFWVARMIFSALKHTGKAPFQHVFIHGIMRDSQGRKMSKSLNNGIDPLEVIDKYGADALRFTLASGNSPGNDMRFYTERVEASRNFANKLWNASRFVLMNLKGELTGKIENPQTEDLWILSRFNSLAAEVGEALEKFEVGIALSKLYSFIWDVFCDWYIELVKPRLYDEKGESALAARETLGFILSGVLKLLHPYMPFITEEIYSSLPIPGKAGSIMVEPWPVFDKKLQSPLEESRMEIIIEAIKAVRAARAEMNVPPSRRAQLIIATKEGELFESGRAFFERLAGASEVIITADDTPPANSLAVISPGARLFMPMDQLVDMEKELARLSKERDDLLGEIKRAQKKLSNKGFLDKAPAELVENERKKAEKYQEMLDKTLESISKLVKG